MTKELQYKHILSAEGTWQGEGSGSRQEGNYGKNRQKNDSRIACAVVGGRSGMAEYALRIGGDAGRDVV